jgi:hypothetical protein
VRIKDSIAACSLWLVSCRRGRACIHKFALSDTPPLATVKADMAHFGFVPLSTLLRCKIFWCCAGRRHGRRTGAQCSMSAMAARMVRGWNGLVITLAPGHSV